MLRGTILGEHQRLERWANTGGPASRTRKMRIASSLLGQEDGHIRCPRVIRLGLQFPEGVDPVAYFTENEPKQGLDSYEVSWAGATWRHWCW